MSISGALRSLALSTALLAAGGASAVTAPERQALVDLYNATNGAAWTTRTNWLGATGTECTWYGVTCTTGAAYVEKLELENNNLVGTIPSTIWNLTSLTTLSLRFNKLSGAIPAIPSGPVSLPALQILKLDHNQLTGGIPPDLGSIWNLQTLWLLSNPLGGAIPPELGNLSQLQELDLSQDQLTGSIPESLGNLPNLTGWLALEMNALTGSIPATFGNLPAYGIDLSYNQLSGTIPAEIAFVTSLRCLYLDRNQLTGPVPAWLGSMASLQYLTLGGNHLSGGIPPELGNLTALTSLDLGSNQLAGAIPASIGNLAQLTSLFLETNQLTGSIPSTLASLTKLGLLDLRWNGLYTADAALASFLSSKQSGGDWQSTQTVPPRDVAVRSPSLTGLTVGWTPIAYAADSGYYEVLQGTSPGGPYAPAGRTAGKSASSLTLSGLAQATTYTFRVRTVTQPHTYNQNTITSDASAEASGSTLSPCAPSLTSTSASVGAAGSTASAFGVRAATGCSWTAVSNEAWITVTSGASGSGDGTVLYDVAPNTGAPRSGTITAATLAFTVSQQGAPCTYAISPVSANVPVEGAHAQSFAVQVLTGSECAWTASSGSSWITITSGASGFGGGAVTFDVAANAGAPRTGTITAAGRTFTVQQAGVSCAAPAIPQPAGPSGALPEGAVASVAWNDVFGGSDPAGYYEAQLARDAAFVNVLQTQATRNRSALFTVPAGSAPALFARVRAVADCGTQSKYSAGVRIEVATQPAALIVTQGQSPLWAVAVGGALPLATIRFRNVGGTLANVSFVRSGTFFTVSPESQALAPGAEAVLALSLAPGATTVVGFRQGSVTAQWGSSGSVSTAVVLSVAAAPADVLPVVDRTTVYNLSGQTVSEQTLKVTNPSASPISLAASIGPGGTWLSVDALDLAQPLAGAETRDVRLTIDRTRRTSLDGMPPLFTVLTLRSVGATAGVPVRVFDAEPATVGTPGVRAGAEESSPTFIVPTTVHAQGAEGALFTSDGWIRNISGAAITADLLATPNDGSGAMVATRTIPALAGLRLFDLVQGVFGRTSMVANVEVRPRTLADVSQLVVRVTAEGQPGGGALNQSYSSEIPVYASGSGTSPSRPPLLIAGIDIGPTVRTNIILSETSGAPGAVRLTLADSEGNVVARSANAIPVPAYGVTQSSVQNYLSLPSGTILQGALLTVEGASGSGRVVALGTAIDNVSQSFRTLSAMGKGAPIEIGDVPAVIPSIVHSSGIGVFFTTRLAITNAGVVEAPLRFVYAYSGTDGEGRPTSGTRTVEYRLAPGRSLGIQRAQDAVVNLLGMPADWNTSGPLRVEGPGVGLCQVRSWVLTRSTDPKKQMSVQSAEFRSFRANSPEVVGQGAQTVSLSSGVSRIALQRTNLILTEVAGAEAHVKVRLEDGVTGLRIGESAPISLAPWQKIQINDAELWPMLSLSGERDHMHMVLESVEPGTGRVAAMLTQITNGTSATLVTPFGLPGPQSPGMSADR